MKLGLAFGFSVFLGIVGCATATRDSFTPGDDDAGPIVSPFAEAEAPAEVDPYANDPAPKWCGPAGEADAQSKPTGTEACPSDKNKPKCACDTLGEKVACWTGLRANRKLGVCKDGFTTCQQINETTRGWGPCEGEVLPVKGETHGKNACTCFSEGQWKIANPTPCVITYPNGALAMVSTVLDAATGKYACPELADSTFPPPKPTAPWSTTSLTADCAGTFELCFELKAGDIEHPSPADCSLTKVCQQASYATAGAAQPLSTLPSWISTDAACIAKFNQGGGYSEMTVKGLSVRCDAIDDGKGGAQVFRRGGYCALKCAENPALPECLACSSAGIDGTF